MKRNSRTLGGLVAAIAALCATLVVAPSASAASTHLCTFAKARTGETALTAITNLESKRRLN